MGFQPNEGAEELAVARRLWKLGAMPVDTSRLDAALREKLPARRRMGRRWGVAVAGIAAMLLIVAMVGMGLLQGRTVEASPAMMAQWHEEIVSGRVPMMRVTSVRELNAQMAALAKEGKMLPEVPMGHSMACCMRSVGDKQVACVLLEDEGKPVTMAVADASEVKSPASGVTMRDGVAYHVEKVGVLNMVMTEKGGRWVCLIGEVPAERLMGIAAGVRF
ncbi:MAG: hypothetical protein ACTHN5_06290 [Phycisphaerae bacterium]